MDYEKFLELQKKINGIAYLSFVPSKEIEHFFKENNIEYKVFQNARSTSEGQMIFIVPKKDKPIRIVFEDSQEKDAEIEFPNFVVAKGKIIQREGLQ